MYTSGMPALRVVATLALTAAAAALLWWCRPVIAANGGPDATVVRAAAWAAWATVGYLAAGFATVAALRLTGADGPVATLAAAAVPASVRRAVELLLGTTVLLGAGATAAVAGPGHGRAHDVPAVQ